MTIRRRQSVLSASVAVALAVILALFAAGTLFAAGAPEEEVEPETVPADGESPMLTEMVERGEILPLEERLPENPLVLDPPDSIGRYGGTLEIVTTGDPGGTPDFMGLLRASRDLAEVEPNIAADFELSDDATTLWIELRRGLRWSDGEPFTTDDIVFAWEDYMMHDDLTPGEPSGFRIGMEVEKIDDYTVEFHFADPAPQALREFSRIPGMQPEIFLPKHFMERFHIDYADPDELQAWVDEADGVEAWYELPIWEINWGSYHEFQSPEGEFMPVMDPFVTTELTSEYAVHTRNPYYWATDPEGNQLPYLDEIFLRGVADSEVQEAQVIAGEVDYHEGSFENFPLYVENEERGGYQVHLYEDLRGAHATFGLNQTYDGDDYLVELFREPDFRRAMSLALDREEINEIVFLGEGEPRQMSLVPASASYNEEYAQAYAEYDPDRANEKLDALGLDDRDADGYRLLPNGDRLTITHVSIFDGDDMVQIFELANEYWSEVGIEVILDLRGSEAFAQAASNEIQLWSWLGDGVTDVFFPYNHEKLAFFVPVHWSSGWNVEAVWSTEWSRWYRTDGEEGVEPPPEYMELIEAYREISALPRDHERFDELADKILSFQAENVIQIGTVGLTPAPRIVRNRIRNVPEDGYAGWDAFFAYPYRREMWYIGE